MSGRWGAAGLAVLALILAGCHNPDGSGHEVEVGGSPVEVTYAASGDAPLSVSYIDPGKFVRVEAEVDSGWSVTLSFPSSEAAFITVDGAGAASCSITTDAGVVASSAKDDGDAHALCSSDADELRGET